jgi:hypothetical protein
MKIKPIASNMTELVSNDGTVILFSYETPVACKLNGSYYKTSQKWSVTTSRHISKWLSGVIAAQAEQSFFDNLTAI